MKKLILFCFLFIGTLTSFGQSFTLTDTAHVALVNGDTIMISGDAGITLDAFAYIKNNATVAKDVMVRKREYSIVNGSENFFCWGLCFGPNTFLSVDPVNIGAGVTNDLDFSAHYMANGYHGISHTSYTFFDKENPNDSIILHVLWNAGTVGIDEPVEKVSFSNAFPNPANGIVSFYYSLPSGKYADAQVIVKNLLGAVVKSHSLEGNKGKLQLNVNDLETGVYFYTLRLDGANFITKKLVIK